MHLRLSASQINRSGQIVFLPNIPPDRRKDDGAPIFYEYDFKRTPLLLKLDSSSTIYTRREAIRQDVARAKEEALRRREAKPHAQQNDCGDSGDKPGTHFNKNHAVEQMLERYGYQRDGRSNDWRSPLQTSGSYATRVYDCRIWVSCSGSDIDAGIGMRKKSFCLGGAFDLYVYYEHDGDFTAAVWT